MPTVQVVMVAYNNPDRVLTRWKRDILPALSFLNNAVGVGWAVTVIDNSYRYHAPLFWEFGEAGYQWQEGRNLMYGPALNAAVRAPEVPAEYVLYVCSNHGKALDPAWACDLIRPMLADPAVALTGHLMGSNSPEGVADHGGPVAAWVKDAYRFTHSDGTGHVPQHVQGGVFAARADVMKAHPYPEDNPRLTHLYTDHLLTWEVLKAGYKVIDVPTVKSVWKEVVRDTSGLRYIHDISEGA